MAGSIETAGVSAAGLRAEADRLHRLLFGGAAPEEVRRQYAAALKNAPLAENIARLWKSGADLEALELVLRKGDPSNPLTRRFRTLCYLAEARPEYFARFVAARGSFPGGIFTLGWTALRTIVHAVKGAYLLRKHGLG
ncbi:MAG TPA: hypothetical protein VGA73_06335 [Candidatus Binatia bacterium]